MRFSFLSIVAGGDRLLFSAPSLRLIVHGNSGGFLLSWTTLPKSCDEGEEDRRASNQEIPGNSPPPPLLPSYTQLCAYTRPLYASVAMVTPIRIEDETLPRCRVAHYGDENGDFVAPTQLFPHHPNDGETRESKFIYFY